MITKIVFPKVIAGDRKEFCLGDYLNGVEITEILFDSDAWVIFANIENERKIACVMPMPGTIFYYD